MSRRNIFRIAILAGAIAFSARAVTAQNVSSVTGAGGATFASAASFNTVRLMSLKFGMGVLLAGGGASGDFESTLLGTSATDQPQTITVLGKPVSGSGTVGSATNISGLCIVNMGDGTPPQTGVPFALTVVSSDGRGSLTLTLGGTSLPAAVVNAGSITVR
jgi:hypothetical protein